jgi:hypothetical protein
MINLYKCYLKRPETIGPFGPFGFAWKCWGYPQKTSWFLLVKIVDPAPQLRILFLSSSQASVETGIQLPVFQAAKFA